MNTYRMWQRLPRRASDKSISIVKAPYPVYNKQFDNSKAAADYEVVLDITKEARSLLSQYNILKNGKVFVEVENAALYETAVSQKDSIVSLIKAIDAVEVVKSVEDIPQGVVLQAVSPEINVHLLVKGHVDIDAEIAKAQKKLDKIQKSKESIEKIVNTKDYAVKANKEAQEQNQTKLDNASAEIEGFEQTIANLERLKL